MIIIKKTLLSAASFACLLPSLAIAESPNWTFVEASYMSIDLSYDTFNSEPDGFQVAGSLGIGDWIYIDAKYSEESGHVNLLGESFDLDFNRVGAGIGAAWNINDTTDIYGHLGYEDWEIEVDADGYSGSESVDENGITAAVGIRSLIWQSLELRGEIGYNDIVEEATFMGGAYYTFADHFTIGGSYEKIDDLETLKATVRYQF